MTKTCPKCGKENSQNVKFCGDCGTELQKGEHKCDNCGIIITDKSQFCRECGNNLINSKTNTCPNCNENINDKSIFCRKCGEKLKKEEPNVKKTNKIKNNTQIKEKIIKNKKTLTIIIILAIIIVGGLIVYNMVRPITDYDYRLANTEMILHDEGYWVYTDIEPVPKTSSDDFIFVKIYDSGGKLLVDNLIKPFSEIDNFKHIEIGYAYPGYAGGTPSYAEVRLCTFNGTVIDSKNVTVS